MKRCKVLTGVLWVLTSLVLSNAVWAQGFPFHKTSPAQPKWESSGACEDCHPLIYEEWRASMHGKAGMKGDPVFARIWPIFAQAMKANQGQEIFFCGNCHTPATTKLGKYVSGQELPNPSDPEQGEGVTCHFCHSITAVEDTPVMPIYHLSVSDTYFGIHGDVKPVGHQVEASSLHQSSKICSGCHGYLKLNSVSVCNLQTEEWGGKENCLGCHMSVTLGAPSVDSDRETHYSHLFPGAHFSEMLAWAATLDMKALKQGGKYFLTVSIFNQNAHKLPSTQPFRVAFLQVKAYDAGGKVVWQNFKEAPQEDEGAVFVKLFGKGDKVGVPTWEADRVAVDTRIGPRSEISRFYEIETALRPVKVQAQLFYYLVPPPLLKAFGLQPDGYIEKAHFLASQELPLD